MLKENEKNFYAFPEKISETDEYSIKKIKENYEYYKDKYPTTKSWFVNRFGKKFLIDNGFIFDDNEFIEESLKNKIFRANTDEVLINFQESEIRLKDKIELIESLYKEKSYEKAMIFFKQLDCKQKIEFLREHKNYGADFIAICSTLFENDSIKINILENGSDEFSVISKIELIASLKNEDKKVELYEEILDEIIEFDENQLNSLEEGEDSQIPIIGFISERVLDSLNNKDNIIDFMLKFNSFPVIKYEHLKDMNKADIDYLLNEIGEDLDAEEYVAFLRTDKVDDDNIIEMLKNNWEDGLEFSNDELIEIPNDISYTYKVFALMKIKDDDKRNNFLDDNIEYFSPEEISNVLEMIEDSEKLLNLAKKYDLPEDYYYYLITLCEDEYKFDCLENDKKIDLDNFKRIASSIQNIPQAFEYIINLENLNVINKMDVINELNMIFCENPSEIYEKKFEFLIENKKMIIDSIKSDDDFEVFNVYAAEFWTDSNKMNEIEKDFNHFIEDEDR